MVLLPVLLGLPLGVACWWISNRSLCWGCGLLDMLCPAAATMGANDHQREGWVSG
jgi:hypothetical protein